MTVSNFMVSRDDIITLRRGDTIQRAIEKMATHNVNSVVIQEGTQVVGIVTSQDIFKKIASRKSAGLSKTMESIMSMDLIAIDSEEPKNNAIKQMEENEIHHLLVTDGNNNYVGIISSFDLVQERALDLRAHPWTRNN